MNSSKDDPSVIKFMTLFGKLRDMIDDDPAALAGFAASDEKLRQLCYDLGHAAWSLSSNERRRKRLFAAPVDPGFIAAWRDYEDRYSALLGGLLVFDAFLPGGDESPSLDAKWDIAQFEAETQAGVIEKALEFAWEQATDETRDFRQGFPEQIEEGVAAWEGLRESTGFDLEGVFRRRELVPFVLIPRHVSRKHGDAEPISLLTHLQQAHDAFVFGVPFAALALMRSILETVLTDHYFAEGQTLGEKIKNCRRLPPNAPRHVLNRLRHLANDTLHLNKQQARLPQDMEKEMLCLLQIVRNLIEGAPLSRGR